MMAILRQGLEPVFQASAFKRFKAEKLQSRTSRRFQNRPEYSEIEAGQLVGRIFRSGAGMCHLRHHLAPSMACAD